METIEREYAVAEGFTKEGLLADMAERYATRGGCDDATARECALATWYTDWTDWKNNRPRDRDMAFEQVDGDLEYWGEE